MNSGVKSACGRRGISGNFGLMSLGLVCFCFDDEEGGSTGALALDTCDAEFWFSVIVAEADGGAGSAEDREGEEEGEEEWGDGWGE